MYRNCSGKRHRRNYRKGMYILGRQPDISQTIVQGYFNMMMVVDAANMKKDFAVVCDELEALGTEIGVAIRCQREEIFEKMHRL